MDGRSLEGSTSPDGETVNGEHYCYDGGAIDPLVILEVDGSFAGNAFFIRRYRDAVVTAAHVVDSATTVRAIGRTVDGQEVWFYARAAAWDAERDLAVVRLPNRVDRLSPNLGLDTLVNGEVVLVGYGSMSNWDQSLQEDSDPCEATLEGTWLYYGLGGPGGHGFSGSAVLSASNRLILACHHGSPGTSPNRAAIVDLGIIRKLRNEAFNY